MKRTKEKNGQRDYNVSCKGKFGGERKRKKKSFTRTSIHPDPRKENLHSIIDSQ